MHTTAKFVKFLRDSERVLASENPSIAFLFLGYYAGVFEKFVEVERRSRDKVVVKVQNGEAELVWVLRSPRWRIYYKTIKSPYVKFPSLELEDEKTQVTISLFNPDRGEIFIDLIDLRELSRLTMILRDTELESVSA